MRFDLLPSTGGTELIVRVQVNCLLNKTINTLCKNITESRLHNISRKKARKRNKRKRGKSKNNETRESPIADLT